MNTDIKIAFVGGDMRQIFCAKELAQKGFEVALTGFEKFSENVGLCTRCHDIDNALEKADVAVLPLPVSNDGVLINTPLSDKSIRLDYITGKIKNCKLVLYGTSCATLEQFCKKNDIAFCDYCKREDYQIRNAVPTAEGALAIAINEMPVTIHGTRAFCMGYGRIGKIMCRMLNSLGAEVWTCARKPEDIAWAQTSGYNVIHTEDMEKILPECKLIINTIPKTIIKDDLLDKIQKDALIIDLASKPGGIDFKPAKSKGLNVIWALSLPGKFSPVSAGKILADTLYKVMEEYGI